MKNRLAPLFFCVIFLSTFHMTFAKEWKRAYLASYPQSGNHWARYLVEEASHIATSSVYRKLETPEHMKKIFPWGGYCCDHGYAGDCRYPDQDDIVLIKTHYPYPHKETQFDRLPYRLVIRIVRNPIDTFASRYVKLPRAAAPKEHIPTDRVKELIKSWRTFQTYWNKKKNVITIRYEDMLENPSRELKKICKTLHYDVTDEDIARAVAKHPPEGDMFKSIGRFKKEDLLLISKELKDLLDQFNYEIPL